MSRNRENSHRQQNDKILKSHKYFNLFIYYLFIFLVYVLTASNHSDSVIGIKINPLDLLNSTRILRIKSQKNVF